MRRRRRRPECASRLTLDAKPAAEGARAGASPAFREGKPLWAPASWGSLLPPPHATDTWGAKDRKKEGWCLGRRSSQLLRKADYPPPRQLVSFFPSDLLCPSDSLPGCCLVQPHSSLLACFFVCYPPWLLDSLCTSLLLHTRDSSLGSALGIPLQPSSLNTLCAGRPQLSFPGVGEPPPPHVRCRLLDFA